MTRLARLGVGILVLLASAAASAESTSAESPKSWPNRGRLGMEVQSMTDALREFFGAPLDRGVLVVRVLPDRAAAQAGMQVGDVVTSAGGEAIDDPLGLIAAIARVPTGEKLALEVVRKGKTETVEVAPEGDPVEFTPSEHGGHDFAPNGHPDFHEEMLNRLRGIEQRLDSIEKK